jgi:hypothetical protein
MIRVFRVPPGEAFREALNRDPDLVAADVRGMLEMIARAEGDRPGDPELGTLRCAVKGLAPHDSADIVVLRGGGMFRTTRVLAAVLDGAA